MFMSADVRDLVELLTGVHLSRSTIRRASESGALKAERIGRYWASRPEDVRAYAATLLESRDAKPAA
jgi:hypothetical protein